MYVADDGGLLHRAEIHHVPWRLQEADATIHRVELPQPRVELAGAPHLMYSEVPHVVIWPLERV